MTVVNGSGRSGRGLGVLLLLGLLALGFLAAMSAGDLRRYLKIRSM